jgi:hypothetical protein
VLERVESVAVFHDDVTQDEIDGVGTLEDFDRFPTAARYERVITVGRQHCGQHLSANFGVVNDENISEADHVVSFRPERNPN